MVQINQITRLAVAVFQEEGQITISGEGMLKKMFLSAYLSEDHHQILPPREHFYFNRNSHALIDKALVRKVATYFMLSDSDAERAVRRWEDSVKSAVRESAVPFGEYGQFQFDNQLDFVPEALTHYQWLPVLPYRSPGVDVEEYSVRDRAPVDLRAALPPKKTRPMLIPALWGVFASLFVLALFFWSEPIQFLFGNQQEFNTRLVNVAPESYLSNDIEDYYSDTQESVTFDAEPATELDEHEKYSETTDEDFSSASDRGVGEAIQVNQNKTNPEERAATSSSRCTLVLGAFANPENVNRMVSRLGDFEVEVITMERQTMTLVAAKVECADQSEIDLLRSEIEPDAWVYK